MESKWLKVQLGAQTLEYNTDEILGKGMYGVVNPARLLQNDQVIKDDLCVKRIRTDEMTQDQKTKLGRENEVLQKVVNLGNKNIVTTIGITSDDKWLYILMQKCSQGDLKELMDQKENQFTPKEVIEIIGSIVNGYKGLQIYSIVHRDLKPANIIINKEPIPGLQDQYEFIYKLSDFGMSRVIDEAQQQQSIKLTRVGTPYYMSPQVILELPYREKSDVYSLGLIAHQLIHQGSYPYIAHSTQQIKNAIKALEKKPHTCEKCKSGATAPKDLLQLIESMLRFNEADRPSWKDLEEHPLIRPYITQQDHYTTYSSDQVTTYNKTTAQYQPQPIQPQPKSDRGLNNIKVSIANNTLQDSMFLTNSLPVGEKLTKSQRIEKFLKILQKKGDQAFEVMILFQQFFALYPLSYDTDFSLLLMILVSYKYNTLLSCYGLLTQLPSYVTPNITSIVQWDSLKIGLTEFQSSNPEQYNLYINSILGQIQYFFGLQQDLIRDYLYKTRGVIQDGWVYKMLNYITNDYAEYLKAIQYLHQTKIRDKLNSFQALLIPHPNQYLVIKIYYYLEMLMRIDSTYPFSAYIQIQEETIGEIPIEEDLCNELTKIYQQPVN